MTTIEALKGLFADPFAVNTDAFYAGVDSVGQGGLFPELPKAA